MKQVDMAVAEFGTVNLIGFTDEEIEQLLKDFPTISREAFFRALDGVTCTVIDDKLITYRCDVVKALRCGLERRSLRADEWD